MTGASLNSARGQEGLKIERLDFLNFRNYETFHLEDIGNLTVFIGRNAVGKTNVLEGIQLLTSAHSFRHPQVAQLVRDGCESSRISIKTGDGKRDLDIALFLEKGKKRYTLNGKGKMAADIRGVLPSIAFTPDDLQLVKHSSTVKRTALDNLGMQLTRSYYVVRKDYEKTVRYKNRLLKEEASQVLVDSINETLVTCAAQLFCLRTALFRRMVPAVSAAYERLSGEQGGFEATYRPSWNRVARIDEFDLPDSRDEARDVLSSEISRWGEEERRRSRCLIGPHNDEIVFKLDGRDASAFASQGQQRSIVLAWKLAEVETVKGVMGVKPVLLLDDVMSELDETRRSMLVKLVNEDIQTFMTATDLDGFASSLVERAHVVKLPLA